MSRQPRTKVRIGRIIDGDTIEVNTGGFLRSGSIQRLRLYGIDAPEQSQKNGSQSTKHLQKLVGGRSSIWIELIDTDQYGRSVAILYPDKNAADSFNYRMVADGQAHCYLLKPADRAKYELAQAKAQSQRKGIWKQRKLEHPTDYRRRQRARKNRKLSPILTVIIIGLIILSLVIYGQLVN